jgi:hypothetical protein
MEHAIRVGHQLANLERGYSKVYDEMPASFIRQFELPQQTLLLKVLCTAIVEGGNGSTQGEQV